MKREQEHYNKPQLLVYGTIDALTKNSGNWQDDSMGGDCDPACTTGSCPG